MEVMCKRKVQLAARCS